MVVIRHSTITDNSAPDGAGSGIASAAVVSMQTVVHSSIVAGNANSDVDLSHFSSSDSTNSFQSDGYNLIGSGNEAIAAFDNNDQTGVLDPRLGPLADNGGPTMTHALVAASPAIDASDPSAMAGMNDVPLYDQRGNPFSRVLGARIDIGAFETQPTAPVVPGDYNGDGIVNAIDYVVWRDSSGAMVTPYTGADGDGSGTVDERDYTVWNAGFGNTRQEGADGAIRESTATATSPSLRTRAVLAPTPDNKINRPVPDEAPTLLPWHVTMPSTNRFESACVKLWQEHTVDNDTRGHDARLLTWFSVPEVPRHDPRHSDTNHVDQLRSILDRAHPDESHSGPFGHIDAVFEQIGTA